MKEIRRDRYLKQLEDCQWDGQVKVVTGIRRCGKSYLLKHLFRKHLLESGLKETDILCIELDVDENAALRHPLRLGEQVRKWMAGAKGRQRVLVVDEIQMCEEVPNSAVPEGKKLTFYDTLNGLRNLENLDIYVTGSNSRMLAGDVLTEFRGRADDIRLHPL